MALSHVWLGLPGGHFQSDGGWRITAATHAMCPVGQSIKRRSVGKRHCPDCYSYTYRPCNLSHINLCKHTARAVHYWRKERCSVLWDPIQWLSSICGWVCLLLCADWWMNCEAGFWVMRRNWDVSVKWFRWRMPAADRHARNTIHHGNWRQPCMAPMTPAMSIIHGTILLSAAFPLCLTD